MKPYLIRTPIWDNRKVGIAEFRIHGQSFFDIKIRFRDSNGKLLYPETYRMGADDAMKYPVQMVKGVKLRIIPIEDFEII